LPIRVKGALFPILGLMMLSGCAGSEAAPEVTSTPIDGWIRTSTLGDGCDSLQAQRLTLSDSNGERLGVVELDAPVKMPSECRTSFAFDLPAGDLSPVYTLELDYWGHANSLDLTADELVDAPHLFYSVGIFKKAVE
jgi:hypothetical protein